MRVNAKTVITPFAAAFALIGWIGPSAAQVDCGPHSRLGSVEQLPGGRHMKRD
jgi:hypothetical protein